MSQKQTGRYCSFCQENKLAVGNKPNHVLHLFLSIFTFTLWVPIWVLVSVGKIGGFRCTGCGNRV